jgi:hypothetical protein
MDCRPNSSLLLLLTLTSLLLGGCISYQIAKYAEGDEVVAPAGKLEVGETTLGEVLSLLGAPDRVVELEGQNLLVYQRSLAYSNRLRFGIPVISATRSTFDFSTSGNLVRYDSLALFFSPEGILLNKVFEEGSNLPYFKTLFSDEGATQPPANPASVP